MRKYGETYQSIIGCNEVYNDLRKYSPLKN